MDFPIARDAQPVGDGVHVRGAELDEPSPRLTSFGLVV